MHGLLHCTVSESLEFLFCINLSLTPTNVGLIIANASVFIDYCVCKDIYFILSVSNTLCQQYQSYLRWSPSLALHCQWHRGYAAPQMLSSTDQPAPKLKSQTIKGFLVQLMQSSPEFTILLKQKTVLFGIIVSILWSGSTISWSSHIWICSWISVRSQIRFRQASLFHSLELSKSTKFVKYSLIKSLEDYTETRNNLLSHW